MLPVVDFKFGFEQLQRSEIVTVLIVTSYSELAIMLTLVFYIIFGCFLGLNI